MPRYLSVSFCAALDSRAPRLESGAGRRRRASSGGSTRSIKRELVLSTDQVTRLEEVFQAAGPAMRTGKEALDQLQNDLSVMVRDGRADEAAAADLIAQVEAARGELGKTRALMLYRMRRLLTSDQHTKLQVLFAEHQRSRRGRAKPTPGAVVRPLRCPSTMTRCGSSLALALALAAALPATAVAQDASREALVRDAVARFEAAGRDADAPAAEPVRRGAARRADANCACWMPSSWRSRQNLDIAVERLNPQAVDFQLAGLRNSLPARWPRPPIGMRSQVNCRRPTS